MEFKDLFSVQASDYKKYRPGYPPELFQWIASYTPEKDAVWDCGTGNGQAAVGLAKHFNLIFATDPSEKQLAEAEQNPRIRYARGSAEDSGLPDHSVSAVTVAQAFHWFQHEKFFKEVKRVTRPKGLLVLWTYAVASINPEVDQLTKHLYQDILGPYWEKERQHVDEGYKNIPVPFEQLFVPKFRMQEQWSLQQWVGYLQTWSALQTLIKKENRNPLETLWPDFQKAWGDDPKKTVQWPLTVRAFRI